MLQRSLNGSGLMQCAFGSYIDVPALIFSSFVGQHADAALLKYFESNPGDRLTAIKQERRINECRIQIPSIGRLPRSLRLKKSPIYADHMPVVQVGRVLPEV